MQRARNNSDLSTETSRLVAAVERARTWRTELTEDQAAVMQSLDDAVRSGTIAPEVAAEIECVIRKGHVHGARKRITRAQAKYRGGSEQ